MKHLIDKSALVAEFNRLIVELVEEGESTMFEKGRISAFEDAKLLLDTIEVKEVNLCKEEERIWKDFNMGERHLSKNDLEKISKHFFGLGMSVKNKEHKGE